MVSTSEQRFPIVTLPAPVSVLMPVCGEVDIIEKVVQEWANDVFRFLPDGSEFVFDVAPVGDGTERILQGLASRFPFIGFTDSPQKDGYGGATRRLYARARCPLVFLSDSDGQYVARDFWVMAHYIGAYDLVHGAKVGRKDRFVRRFASFVFNKAVHFLFCNNFDDVNSAFKFMKRDLLDDLLPQLTKMPKLINTELLLRADLANYEIKQCYITHRVRRFGNSRGLPAYRFLFDALVALRGLMAIKASYRVFT